MGRVADRPWGSGPAMRRLTFTILAVSTVITALVPVSPARAAGTITLFGSGNGHGIGLSQWGAFGLAQDGWSHGDILTHFYQGTRVSSTAALPRHVRVGLTTDERTIHLRSEERRAGDEDECRR